MCLLAQIELAQLSRQRAAIDLVTVIILYNNVFHSAETYYYSFRHVDKQLCVHSLVEWMVCSIH